MKSQELATSLDIRVQLSAYGEQINTALAEFFEELPELLKLELSNLSSEALQMLRDYSLRPSKRIRGSLAAYAYDFTKKSQYGKPGIQLGVALELLQSYLLIVDDVMDKSDLRRGQPTIHELFLKQTDQHTANMLAINVGLIAQHLANIVLMRTDEDAGRLQRVAVQLHKNIAATGFGQMDDVSQHVTESISEREIIQKYQLKSGYYTFVNPLQSGLMLGGISDEAVLQEVEEFGLAAGIAFQLYDDILGVFGDEKAVGKSNLDDIKEGKYTLLVQYALHTATPENVAVLRRTLGNEAISREDLGIVQAIFEECGAWHYVEQQAKEYAETAKNYLEQSTVWDQDTKQLLRSLVDFSVKRQK